MKTIIQNWTNKIQAVGAIITAKNWFLAVDAPGTDETKIVHSTLTAKNLKTIANYAQVVMDVEISQRVQDEVSKQSMQ